MDLKACRAGFEEAQRKPNLAELWFYEYAHQLLKIVEEVERIQEPSGFVDLDVPCPDNPDEQHDFFLRHCDGKYECSDCGLILERK